MKYKMFVSDYDGTLGKAPENNVDSETLDAINKFNYERLIYVSCNASTLVRDLERLKNIKIKDVILFDMFARTGEYEILVIMDKK